jgi:hypothetical protein
MNFVSVPGAWHGGWSWYAVGRRVLAAGHPALALTLPGLAMGDDPAGPRLSDATGHIVKEVERRDLHDVVLVGHSFAGIPICAAPGPELAARAGVTPVTVPGPHAAQLTHPDDVARAILGTLN